ncbi:MAG TPA: DinB family protein [Symbiobacteriaceae bacterium]|jgi:uncharacterized damage-inducible protein DinB
MDPVISPTWETLEFGNRRLFKLLEGMTPEQLAERPEGFQNSIAALIVHMAGEEAQFAHWLHAKPIPDDLVREYLLNQAQPPLPQPKGETADSLRGKILKARNLLKDALMGLKAADLDRVIDLPPDTKATVRWQLALVGYHTTCHFGQMQMIKQHLK